MIDRSRSSHEKLSRSDVAEKRRFRAGRRIGLKFDQSLAETVDKARAKRCTNELIEWQARAPSDCPRAYRVTRRLLTVLFLSPDFRQFWHHYRRLPKTRSTPIPVMS
jgi:hypothetical protein